jgi:prepilin-type N-terminal cleavage/methylation domain-containing protein
MTKRSECIHLHITISKKGYSLIELMVVVIIISIIASVSIKSLMTASETARAERTKDEMDELAFAVAGDPGLVSGGTRTDFGYVGDVGSMPASLDALVLNPGGYATWDGPYLKDDYLASAGGGDSEFKMDEWGSGYGFSAGVTITSIGSGQTITRQIANSAGDLLYNSVAVTVTDINQSPPGPIYRDSINVLLTYPNGVGGTVTRTFTPASDGFVQIDSVPIGLHSLRTVYLPDNDTLRRKVAVNPGELATVDVQLFSNPWGSSGPINKVIIRPDGVGDYTEHITSGCTGNWQCVNDVTSDDDGSYVIIGSGPWATESYQAEDPIGSGTIDSVVIFILVRSTGPGQLARTTLVVNANLYLGGNINLNSSPTYTVFSTAYATNPDTSSPWTWAELNDIQIGVGLKDQARCSQVWAEIY